MEIIKLLTGPLRVNTYILIENGQAVVIDAGGRSEKILNAIKEHNAKLTKVLLTHGHFDHIGGVAYLKEQGADVYISALDKELTENNGKNFETPYTVKIEPFTIDVLLNGGEEIEFADKKIKVIATGGHTPGGVCYLIDDVLFSGDTLFSLSVGRTDFIGSDTEALYKNIKEKLFTLPENTIVYPGHGEETTIKIEKEFNPYFR